MGQQQPPPNPGMPMHQSHFMVTWRPRGLSKSVISKVIIKVTPFRFLITLLITHLLSPWASKYGCGRKPDESQNAWHQKRQKPINLIDKKNKENKDEHISTTDYRNP